MYFLTACVNLEFPDVLKLVGLFLPELSHCKLWRSQEAEGTVGRDPSDSLVFVTFLQLLTALVPSALPSVLNRKQQLVRGKCFCCLKGELQPQPRHWARCVKTALKDDCSAVPQWELHHGCEESSSCSSLALSDITVHPWEQGEEESPGLVGMLLARGLRHSKNPA